MFFLYSVIILCLVTTLALKQATAQQAIGPIAKWSKSLSGPTDVAVESGGRFVYVLDTGNNMIRKFDANGIDEPSMTKEWGGFGSGLGKFRNPLSIALDPSDKFIYVADTENNRIQKFDAEGKVLLSWGSLCRLEDNSGCKDLDGSGGLQPGDGQFYFPTGIAIDKTGTMVYVADTFNGRVQKFLMTNGACEQGKGQVVPGVCFAGTFGSFGTGEAQFRSPVDLAVDPDGRAIYVVDSINEVIKKFDLDGRYLGEWGSSGISDGQLSYPLAVTIDPVRKTVYVSDSGNNRVQEYDTEGNFISSFGSTCLLSERIECSDPDGPDGPLQYGDGQFSNVGGLSFESSGTLIFVADSGNNRVQVFGPHAEISIQSLSNKSPRWGIDSVTITGSTNYTAKIFNTRVNWGDGTFTDSSINQDGTWSATKIYEAKAVSSNPNRITVQLASGNNVKATVEYPDAIVVQKHNVAIDRADVKPKPPSPSPTPPLGSTPAAAIIPWGGKFSLPILAYDRDIEQVLPNKSLTFKNILGNNRTPTVTLTTNQYGIANATLDAISYVGNGSVEISFRDPAYYEAFKSITYNTRIHKTTIKVDFDTPQAPWGTQVRAIARLTDLDNNQALQVRSIKFEQLSSTKPGQLPQPNPSFSAITNSTGDAIATIPAANTVKEGWIVRASYAGDFISYSDTSSNGVYNTIRHSTQITLSLQPHQIPRGGTFDATGKVIDTASGKALAGKKITLFAARYPDRIIAESTTNESGIYRFVHIQVPSNIPVRLAISLKVAFQGDDLFAGNNSPGASLIVR